MTARLRARGVSGMGTRPRLPPQVPQAAGREGPTRGQSPGTTRVSRGVGLSLPPRSGPLEGRLGKRGLARPARESNAPFRARKSREATKVDARDTSRRTPPGSPRWSAMSWITRAISARPVDAELAPSVELCRAVTNGFLESYVCWREACEEVRSAYERWGKCKSPQADLTFESYRAALDREDHAARIHAGWAMRLHAVERSATLERAGASFAA